MPEKNPVPDSVVGEASREYYASCNQLRADIKAVASKVDDLRQEFEPTENPSAEAHENVTLAYRHLEDASMRLGKALQALDGGVSVYDKATTVGA